MTNPLVATARFGDRVARNQLFESIVPTICKLGASYCHSIAERDELVQIVRVIAFTRINQFTGRNGADFTTWVGRITINTARNLYRNRRLRERCHDEIQSLHEYAPERPPNPEEQAGARERAGRAVELMKSLRPVDRFIIHAVAAGYTHAEIGVMIGKSPPAARQHYFRVAHRLRVALTTAPSRAAFLFIKHTSIILVCFGMVIQP